MTELFLDSVEALEHEAARFTRTLEYPATLFLQGELGAGKTSFTRGILRALGYPGAVKSPTFSLIETYEVAGLQIAHLDLYRLGSPEELIYTGFRDLLAASDLVLIEWPERGGDELPLPDVRVTLRYASEGPIDGRTICYRRN